MHAGEKDHARPGWITSCSCPTGVRLESLRARHADPDWLPVSHRIRFKLCCLVHAIHYGRSPAYLTETVQSVGASRPRSVLRSSSTSSMDYSLPRSSASGRSHMRVLPPGTLCPTTSAPHPVKFGKLLKSHYFSQA